MTARKKTSPIIIPRATWPEAEIVADPVRENELVEPRVCVRRRIPDLCGPNGEAMFVVHGAGQHISLFTGCGGMDLGVEEAGFVTVVQHEWDKFACDTLILNRPNFFRYSALIQGDIRKTPTSTILREAGLRCGEATLLTGGTPCQGFSTAGKRDAKDIRNTLVFDFLRVVRESQPRFFVMENVPGFVSMKKHDFLRSFLEIAHDAYY
ncbi:MAG TPA: DNA (cytosine-5-)-methyltransferase, partial [Pirellulales bacterium]|nr:DNA (cytosine-5-)-methyltransferase [Pirellulales bacterium]